METLVLRHDIRTTIRRKLRELDPNESIRRKIRTVANFFKEPPPRSKELLFESFSYQHPQVTFYFKVQDQHYISRVHFDCVTEAELRALGDERLCRLMTLVGLSLAPYHFLIADFTSVRVACGRLTADAVRFYEEYFVGGLAEFRYRQGLDPTRPIKVVAETCESLSPGNMPRDGKVLMLNGGGKDTAVMCELLKATGSPLGWLSIEPKVQQRTIADVSGVETRLEIDVKIDPEIFRRPTYRWGHMPTSGMLLAVAMIPALAHGYKYVATGNECSANESNVRYRGMDINHQYTKSHYFESRFNEVTKLWLGTETVCFSALRMFHDIQIASLLEKQYSQYLGHFVSCNKGTSWCNDCEKCAFVFLSLSAFVSPARLIEIFGQDLWENQRTRALMLHLMTSRVKRWECVGTHEECKLAAKMHFERFGSRTFNEWPFMETIEKAIEPIDAAQAAEQLLYGLNENHNIPCEIADRIRKILTANRSVNDPCRPEHDVYANAPVEKA